MDRHSLEAVQRFVRKLVKFDGGDCWNWTAAIYQGYGRIKINGKPQYVHRVAYATFIAPIPEGMTVDHTCRNTLCCNPRHLTLLTNEENTRKSNRDNPRGVVLKEDEIPF